MENPVRPVRTEPLIQVKLEIWNNFKEYVKYGLPWYVKKMYPEYTSKTFARGAYFTVENKVIICLDDIMETITKQVSTETGITDHLLKQVFIQIFYYTLVHELLHASKVENGCCGKKAHNINHDAYEKLPIWLKYIFDDYLATGGEFKKDHPEKNNEA